MTSVKCDDNNDFVVENNDLVFVEGIEEVLIIVKNRLRTYFGEWFLDTSIGVPYFQEIFRKNPSPSRIEEIIRTIIIETPGVIELVTFNLDFDQSQRQLAVSGRIKGQDGVVELYEIIGPSATEAQ